MSSHRQKKRGGFRKKGQERGANERELSLRKALRIKREFAGKWLGIWMRRKLEAFPGESRWLRAEKKAIENKDKWMTGNEEETAEWGVTKTRNDNGSEEC